ncbi:hypothetical protein K439DRAFT_124639 [Ramaria rubella]|nr:hypothetical protein K439DRAFT_424319 [Ramaria rubella]KAF8582701.1 hypothetical protein K439DRAFT_124639 [Ramaria rubella]
MRLLFLNGGYKCIRQLIIDTVQMLVPWRLGIHIQIDSQYSTGTVPPKKNFESLFIAGRNGHIFKLVLVLSSRMIKIKNYIHFFVGWNQWQHLFKLRKG